MGPSEEQNFVLKHRAPSSPGIYKLKLDILAQDIFWFEQQGSLPLELQLEVLDENWKQNGLAARKID